MLVGELNRTQNAYWVSFPKRVDAFNVDSFKIGLESLKLERPRVAFDMRAVEFLNFAAIRCLHAQALKWEASGVEVFLVGPTEKLIRQLSLFASTEPFHILSQREWELQPVATVV